MVATILIIFLRIKGASVHAAAAGIIAADFTAVPAESQLQVAVLGDAAFAVFKMAASMQEYYFVTFSCYLQYHF